MYIYIYIYTYTHIHTYTLTYTDYTYICIYIYTHMSDQRRARPSMMYEGPFALYDEPMESCTDTYICIYIIERDTYIHIHICIYIYRERDVCVYIYIYIYADIGVIDTIGAQDPPCQCCRHIYIYIYTLEHGLFEAWPHDLARSRGYVFAHRSHSEFK